MDRYYCPILKNECFGYEECPEKESCTFSTGKQFQMTLQRAYLGFPEKLEELGVTQKQASACWRYLDSNGWMMDVPHCQDWWWEFVSSFPKD